MTGDRNNDLSMIENRLGALGSAVGAEVPGTRPDRADQVRAEDEVLAGLATLAPPADPPEGLFDAIEAEIDALSSAQIETLKADEGEWIKLSDKIWKKILFSDDRTGESMYLLRCAAGAVLPSHKHDHEEHAFVIEGEFWVGDTGAGRRFPYGTSWQHPSGTPLADRVPGVDACLTPVQ